MSRVTSLTNMSDAQVNRWIKRVGLLFLVVLVAFVAFYAIDRFRAPTAPIADQKIAGLEAAVQKNPGDIASRGSLADAYMAKGRYQDAITQYSAIVDSGKQVEMAKYQRAHAEVALNQLDQAKADYQAVVDIAKGGEMANVDPTLEGAYYGLGDIAMKQGDAKNAVDQLTKALQINRGDSDALYLIGTAYTATGDTKTAVVALKKAIAFVPIGWADPYKALMDAYTKAGDTAEASWASAMVDFVNGGADKAITELQALTSGSAALDAYVGLGIISETQGKNNDARGYYAKALAIDATSDAATLGIGRVGGVASPAPSGNPSTPAASPAPSSSGGN